MIQPQLRNIVSPNLEPPNLPEDPLDCEVLFQAMVGPADGDGGEIFVFAVVTPVRLARTPEATWGRGRLIVPKFDWELVVLAVAELLVECAADDWSEVVAQLDRSLRWIPSDGDADA